MSMLSDTAGAIIQVYRDANPAGAAAQDRMMELMKAPEPRPLDWGSIILCTVFFVIGFFVMRKARKYWEEAKEKNEKNENE